MKYTQTAASFIFITFLFAIPSRGEFSDAFIQVAEKGNPAVVSAPHSVFSRSIKGLASKIIKEHFNGDLKASNQHFTIDSTKYYGACFEIEIPIS